MEEKTLLILAAGLGSRFGGLKQIEPIDKNGNFIIDYSIFDAIKAGFNKVVFVIKQENLEIFKETIGNRIAEYIKVEYAFQDVTRFVDNVPSGRIKPWGTAHAVLCAKDNIVGDFAMINADDFYGFEAYKTAFDFMQNKNTFKEYATITYKVCNTLTENGAVKRGVCTEKNGELTKVVESLIERRNGQIVAKPVDEGEEIVLQENHPVSMNFMCLNSNFFDYLYKYFQNFLKTTKNVLKDECFILNSMVGQTEDEDVKIKVIETTSVWHGVTYKEDKPKLVEEINKLVEQGKYPSNLWKLN